MLESLLVNRTRRVLLNLRLLRDTVHGRKLMALASAIPVAGFDTSRHREIRSLSASALTRYLSGERNPALKTALSIADAIGVDPVELILGYAPDRRVRDGRWNEEVVAASRWPNGMDLSALIANFANVIEYLHPGFVVEGGVWRRALKSPSGFVGYGSFRIFPDRNLLPTDIRILFNLPIGRNLPLIVEFGRISLDGTHVEANELWTLRSDSRAVGAPDSAVDIRLWLGGGGTTFYLISDKPFTVSDAVEPCDDKAPSDVPAVSFFRSAFHASVPARK